MRSLEDWGRVVDEELKRLQRKFEEEIKPTTQRGLARAMRAASDRLAKLASELERDMAKAEGERKP